MTAPAPQAGKLIGRVIARKYECVRRIGQGGMGAVYELRHVRLNRKFALKTLSKDLVEDAQALARFEREADVVAKLRHPNIVDIVDWDTLPDGSPCIIMEYLDGEDLGTRLKREGALPWNMILGIADPILSALCVAHREGIVHRDLKPQNIYLAADDAGEERPKLLDFGVSKIRGSGTLATTDTSLVGTPAYMSPEQADGRPEDIGPSTDCWAMGALLYEMATGQQAFADASVPRVLYKICFGAPPNLLELRPDAPAAFVTLIERTLSRDAKTRLADAEILRSELRAALAVRAPSTLSQPLRRATPLPFAASDDVVAGTDETELAAPPAMIDQPTTLGTSAGESIRTAPPPDATGHRGRLLVAGAFVAVAAAGVAIWQWPRGENAPPATATAATAAANVDASGARPEQSPAPDPDAARKTSHNITVRIETRPGNARVYREADGVLLGPTPFTKSYERGDGTATFLVKREGFRTERLALTTDRDHKKTITLTPRPVAKPKPHKATLRRSVRKHTAAGRPSKAAPRKRPRRRKKREPIAPPF